MSSSPWYQHALRRSVVDMHITDHDPSFLTQFDPQTYVDLLKSAHMQSAVLYAHSHVGWFYYPTCVGEMHPNLKGRDIFGEMVERLHGSDIKVVAYCSLIFDCYAYNRHPDWRIRLADGSEAGANSRYGVCCPNAPGYRDYVAAWADEMLRAYPVEGVRFDMTFWPAVCYCDHCQKRFLKETGHELPRRIDWDDPVWVQFQRKREEWLLSLAEVATQAARRARPSASVEHQSSTLMNDWRFGVSYELAKYSDFLQGDFYGDALQGSIVRKMLYNLTENLPFGFETSFCETLGSHTNLKPIELLSAKAHAAVGSSGAMIFIDAIDPIGTLNPRTYERARRVFEQTMRYDPFLGGDLRQDVAVYLSTASKYNPADNGKSPLDPLLSSELPHLAALQNACQQLIQHHIPFGIITRRNLDRLSQFRMIVLPDVLMMDRDEAEALRAYVENGGILYASYRSSLRTPDGTRQPNFLLSEVLGVDYQGETRETYTYIAPTPGFEALMPEFSAKYPLGLYSRQVLVTARQGALVLGTITLPYTDTQDPRRFASIHSNPPGIPTDHPAIVVNHFGKGKAVYVSAPLENAVNQGVFARLVKSQCQPLSFEADAPGCVEVTLFEQTEKRCLVINLLNFQKDLPNIPVDGARVRVWMGEKHPLELNLLPEENPLPFEQKGEWVEFAAPRLETFAMLRLRYE